MWSVNSDTWKPAFERNGQHRWENRVEHHAGMSAANQRGRRSTLRRRVVEKQAVMSRQYLAAQRNLNLLLTGVAHEKSN